MDFEVMNADGKRQTIADGGFRMDAYADGKIRIEVESGDLTYSLAGNVQQWRNVAINLPDLIARIERKAATS